jgi:retron-type reverse transcriptase
VLEYEAKLEENLIETQNRLLWHEWEPGRWRQFTVHEPKRREISAPQFCDRVVHHALVGVIEPLFERKFIHDSYACRKNKGNHAAVRRVGRFLQGGAEWILQTDVKSYFPSIDHGILINRISRTVKDADALWLCNRVVGGLELDKGLPIGALTSQMFANIYLDALDHHCKDCLGVKRYVRYMDDCVIVGRSRGELAGLLDEIREFLQNQLHLTLNPKSRIYPASEGVNFCGYRIWPTHVLPRKRNVTRARRRLKKMAPMVRDGRLSLETFRGCLASFRGYMKHCNGWTTERKILEDLAASGRLF